MKTNLLGFVPIIVPQTAIMYSRKSIHKGWLQYRVAAANLRYSHTPPTPSQISKQEACIPVSVARRTSCGWQQILPYLVPGQAWDMQWAGSRVSEWCWPCTALPGMLLTLEDYPAQALWWDVHLNGSPGTSGSRNQHSHLHFQEASSLQ